jgi:hypothetical protein
MPDDVVLIKKLLFLRPFDACQYCTLISKLFFLRDLNAYQRYPFEAGQEEERSVL